MSRLEDIQTLKQRYEDGDLKPATGSTRYPADKALLEKVSLQYVLPP
jgi:hypothetical protein